ncbi:uncharacterized protein AMSG_03249 [Thecamonas trahens ATCC 50062]|uniref:Insulin-degrading enzyme n=1 Tax=Thecamonas trahens ATCC 50062 TaxID=461836 RepID=A0A0L0D675_THETB|nr:hypothetical protein AMSG_03249 [Thecamonas trahens ATCC 50062]KNC46818.1 hypothetical protein AMSG_03249 [Thecamonas trahens ATCC 50062]|eukprot:XP_013760093.1 hypothetical protein AMSG_03249 [Thecamonas trahens ATCC 50062]
MTHIIKPGADGRELRHLVLDNGLECMLVHDPEAEKAAVALSVAVGHMADPESLPGLAHYLEHMLFLGSDKYPEEDAYRKFINDHGGGCNASTSSEKTTYHFDVEASALATALDIFVSIFIAPLFTSSCAAREVKAVDSENSKNLTSNSRRLYQLIKSTAKADYAFAHFGTGNLETLATAPDAAGIDVRAALLDFHAKYYSANLMRMCLVSPLPLDDMAAMLHDAHVPLIANHNAPLPVFDSAAASRVSADSCLTDRLAAASPLPFADPPSGPHWYTMVPVSEERSMRLAALGSPRPGWATELSAYTYLEHWEFTVLAVKVMLTPAGLDSTDAIAAAVFHMLRLVAAAPDAVLAALYAEHAAMAEINFTFREKSSPRSTAKSLAVALHTYAPEHILVGPYLHSPAGLNVGLLRNVVLPCLVPELARVYVVAHATASSASLTERWYGTKYGRVELSSEQRALFNGTDSLPALCSTLALPELNPYIPDSFDILPGCDGVRPGSDDPLAPPVPLKLIDDATGRVFYIRDTVYAQPKVLGSVTLYSHEGTAASPGLLAANYVLDLFLRDALREFKYPASLAGLHASSTASSVGYRVSFGGYSQHMGTYLVDFLAAIRAVVLDPGKFEVFRDQALKVYLNRKSNSPHWHARRHVAALLVPASWSDASVVAQLASLRFADVEAALGRFMRIGFAETLVYGNVSAETVVGWDAALRHAMGWAPLPLALLPHTRCVALRPGSRLVTRARAPHDDDTNSALALYFHIPNGHEPHVHYATLLLQQVIKQMAFDDLRTRQQLGYVVWTLAPTYAGERFFGWVIQSAEHSPDALEAAIDQFVAEHMAPVIASLATDAALLEQHKAALILKHTLRDKTFRETFSSARSLLTSHRYEFDRKDRAAARIAALAATDLASIFDRCIAPPGAEGPSARAVVAVKYHGRNHVNELTAGTVLDVERASAACERLIALEADDDAIAAWQPLQTLHPVRFPLRVVDPLLLTPTPPPLPKHECWTGRCPGDKARTTIRRRYRHHRCSRADANAAAS